MLCLLCCWATSRIRHLPFPPLLSPILPLAQSPSFSPNPTQPNRQGKADNLNALPHQNHPHHPHHTKQIPSRSVNACAFPVLQDPAPGASPSLVRARAAITPIDHRDRRDERGDAEAHASQLHDGHTHLPWLAFCLCSASPRPTGRATAGAIPSGDQEIAE